MELCLNQFPVILAKKDLQASSVVDLNQNYAQPKKGRFAPPRKKRPPRSHMHQILPLFSTNLEYVHAHKTNANGLSSQLLLFSYASVSTPRRRAPGADLRHAPLEGPGMKPRALTGTRLNPS